MALKKGGFGGLDVGDDICYLPPMHVRETAPPFRVAELPWCKRAKVTMSRVQVLLYEEVVPARLAHGVPRIILRLHVARGF